MRVCGRHTIDATQPRTRSAFSRQGQRRHAWIRVWTHSTLKSPLEMCPHDEPRKHVQNQHNHPECRQESDLGHVERDTPRPLLSRRETQESRRAGHNNSKTRGSETTRHWVNKQKKSHTNTRYGNRPSAPNHSGKRTTSTRKERYTAHTHMHRTSCSVERRTTSRMQSQNPSNAASADAIPMTLSPVHMRLGLQRQRNEIHGKQSSTSQCPTCQSPSPSPPTIHPPVDFHGKQGIVEEHHCEQHSADPLLFIAPHSPVQTRHAIQKHQTDSLRQTHTMRRNQATSRTMKPTKQLLHCNRCQQVGHPVHHSRGRKTNQRPTTHQRDTQERVLCRHLEQRKVGIDPNLSRHHRPHARGSGTMPFQHACQPHRCAADQQMCTISHTHHFKVNVKCSNRHALVRQHGRRVNERHLEQVGGIVNETLRKAAPMTWRVINTWPWVPAVRCVGGRPNVACPLATTTTRPTTTTAMTTPNDTTPATRPRAAYTMMVLHC